MHLLTKKILAAGATIACLALLAIASLALLPGSHVKAGGVIPQHQQTNVADGAM